MADYELSNNELDEVEYLQDVLQRVEAKLDGERAIPGLGEFSDCLHRYLTREYARRYRAQKTRPKCG